VNHWTHLTLTPRAPAGIVKRLDVPLGDGPQSGPSRHPARSVYSKSPLTSRRRYPKILGQTFNPGWIQSTRCLGSPLARWAHAVGRGGDCIALRKALATGSGPRA
jgi:hypothetical protein